MLSTKEKMFMDYVKTMFEVQQESSHVTIPSTNYALGKDIKGRVFFLEVDVNSDGYFILNPVQWVRKVCEVIGHGVAGIPVMQVISEDEPLIVSKYDKGNAYKSLEEKEAIIEIMKEFNEDSDIKFDEGYGGLISSVEVFILAEDSVVDLTSKLLFVESLEEVKHEDEQWDLDLEDEEDEDLELEEEEEEEDKFKLTGTDIEVTWENHKTGEIETITTNGSIGVSQFEDSDFQNAIKRLLESEDKEESVIELSDHETIALEVADLVDEKQKAYGDSVGKSERIMEILLEDYDNGDGTYTIPKALLAHLLYQIRIIDKQNRVFSNPEQDLMDESPYADILGYALLMLAKQEKEKE